MLQYMWHSSIIWRICLEADGKDIVAVVASNVEMLGASLVVLQVQCCQLQFRHMLAAEQCEAMKLLASFGKLRELSDCFASAARSIS